MVTLIILAIITVICFFVGRYIAEQEKPMFKKFAKERYSNRTVNNYIGNMIAVFGLIAFGFFAFGMDNMLFFLLIAALIVVVFVVHAAEALGVTTEDIVSNLESPQIRKLSMYKTTIKLVFTVLITGAVATSTHHFVFPEEPKEETKQEDVTQELLLELQKQMDFSSLIEEERVIKVE